MPILIKSATIIDPNGPHHLRQADVLVHNGKIIQIDAQIHQEADEIIDAKGKYLSIAWIDIFAGSGTPGFEYREQLHTLDAAAQAGGFGHLFITPNLVPVTDTASDVRFLIESSATSKTKLFPLGAVSKKLEGKELAEMMDMKAAGAIAFSDGWSPIIDDLLMLKALEYIQGINGIMIQLPWHKKLEGGALMNESERSVAFGMSGAPAVAEEIIVHRDIELARYTGARLHLSGISTAKSLALIEKAKSEGVNVTCSVTPYHLLYTDDALEHYNSLFKVYPVLRTQADVLALREGVRNGIVDCIATHHKPHSWDEKEKEFEYASWGMAALETVWPMLQEALPDLKAEQWVNLLYKNPSTIFDLPTQTIEAGVDATLTLFDMDTSWTLNTSDKQSLAYNIPLLNTALKGKARVIA